MPTKVIKSTICITQPMSLTSGEQNMRQHNFNSPTVIDRQINSSISFGMEGWASFWKKKSFLITQESAMTLRMEVASLPWLNQSNMHSQGCCPSSYPICAQIGCSQHLILVEIKLHDRTRICRCCFRHHIPRLGRGARQDLKCFHNLTLWCTSTNINEIGICITMQLDNIHGSHGQSCSIHQTSEKKV